MTTAASGKKKTGRAVGSGAPRRRRAPEVARREIIDAAERLMALHGPDGVTLQAVGRAAGVSHALVTHYFGTYDGLVMAVLARRRRAARAEAERWLASPEWKPGTGELMQVLLRLFGDATHVRLAAWSMLHGGARRGASLLPADQGGGLRFVVDAVSAQLATLTGRKMTRAFRETVEWNISIAVAAVFGFALMRPALARGLGVRGEDFTLEAFGARVQALVRAGFVEQMRGG